MIMALLRACSISIVLMLNIDVVSADDFNDNDLKSLFTSPEHRNRIDGKRSGRVTGSVSPQFGPNTININGVVKRKNGKSVVWVNGKSTLNNSTIDGARVLTRSLDKKTKIPVNIDGEVVHLQPGQIWSEETGKIIDSY